MRESPPGVPVVGRPSATSVVEPRHAAAARGVEPLLDVVVMFGRTHQCPPCDVDGLLALGGRQQARCVCVEQFVDVDEFEWATGNIDEVEVPVLGVPAAIVVGTVEASYVEVEALPCLLYTSPSPRD